MEHYVEMGECKLMITDIGAYSELVEEGGQRVGM
jgi:hypothetical protein